MGTWNFTTKQCVHALLRLGFTLCNKGRRGNHDKYCVPERLKRQGFAFIMVPRHNNLHCQEEIVKELHALGGDELVQKFKDNL
jgi:hypothetical protein